MKIQEFIESLQDGLNTENLTIDTNLKELPGFDSLANLILISIVDEHFNIELSSEQVQSITYVKDIIKIIGEEKFTK